MAKPNYTACATRPQDVVMCSALESGNYLDLYSEKVKGILGNISDDGLRKRVESTLGIFEERDGRLAQSSPYRLVVLNEILPKDKVLVARPRLQIAKESKPNFMSGFYVDCGLNLASGEQGYQVNQVQAEALAENLGVIGIDLRSPKLVSMNVLTYEVNPKSPNGLVFRLSEQGKDTGRKHILNTLDYKWDYLPSNNGLFRACLLSDGYWDADDVDLAYSNDSGWVVVETTGEASALEFEALKQQSEQLLKRQQKERTDLIKRLQA
jgi:hypothetical protein